MSASELSSALAATCGACAHADRAMPPFAKRLYDASVAAMRSGGDLAAIAAGAAAFEMGALCAIAVRGENRPGAAALWAVELLQRAATAPASTAVPTATPTASPDCTRGIAVESAANSAPSHCMPCSASAQQDLAPSHCMPCSANTAPSHCMACSANPAPAAPTSDQLDKEYLGVKRRGTVLAAQRLLAELQAN